MELSGQLYRRSPRLFSPNKPGDWSLVWCELSLEQGELFVSLDRVGSSRLATIRIKDCDLAHVRSDGRDCFEITVNKAKKETFSSHESSHDVDWWWVFTQCSIYRVSVEAPHPDICCGVILQDVDAGVGEARPRAGDEAPSADRVHADSGSNGVVQVVPPVTQHEHGDG